MATLRHYFRNTQTETTTGGTIYDLSETQGATAADVTGSIGNGQSTFIEVLTWVMQVGTEVTGTSFPTSVVVSSLSSGVEYRWRVQRRNSSGTVQASSAYSTAYTTAGTQTATLTLSTTWATGDLVAVSLEARQASGHGGMTIEVNTQNASSYVDADRDVVVTYDGSGTSAATASDAGAAGVIANGRAVVGGLSYVNLTYTAPDWVSSPYDADREPVDDFELRLHLRLPSWTPTGRHYLASDRASTAGWGLNLETSGAPRLAAYIGATTEFRTATASLTTVATDGEWLWLKVTRVGTTLRYYTSLNGTSWTQLGTDLTLSGSITPETTFGLAINAYASNGSLASGGGQSADYSRVQLWTGGIEGVGTLVNDFDASLATAGTPSTVVAATGETWTFNDTGYEVFVGSSANVAEASESGAAEHVDNQGGTTYDGAGSSVATASDAGSGQAVANAESGVTGPSYVTLPYVDPPTTDDCWVSTPYDSGDQLVDDYEIRLHFKLGTYTFSERKYLAGNGKVSAPYEGWIVSLETTGAVRHGGGYGGASVLIYSDDGLGDVFSGGDWVWLKVTRVGSTVTFYTSTNGTSWTQFGTTKTLTGSITAKTDSGLAIGAMNGAGTAAYAGLTDMDFSRLLVWKGGIEGTGTLVNDFDASEAEAGTPSTVVASTGETWTFNGSAYEVVLASAASVATASESGSAEHVDNQGGTTYDGAGSVTATASESGGAESVQGGAGSVSAGASESGGAQQALAGGGSSVATASVVGDGAGTRYAAAASAGDASEAAAAQFTAPATGSAEATGSDVGATEVVFAASGAAEATASASGAAGAVSGAVVASAADASDTAAAVMVAGAPGAVAGDASEDAAGALVAVAAVGVVEAAASESGDAEHITGSVTYDGTGSSASAATEAGAGILSAGPTGSAVVDATTAGASEAAFTAVAASAAVANEVGLAERVTETAEATGTSAADATASTTGGILSAGPTADSESAVSDASAGVMSAVASGAENMSASSVGASVTTANPTGATSVTASVTGAAVAAFPAVGASESTTVESGVVTSVIAGAGANAADAAQDATGALVAGGVGASEARASSSSDATPLGNLTLAPDATVGAVNIVNELGTTSDLHASVDDAWGTPDDDSTYLVNSLAASGSVTVGLENVPAAFGAMESLRVRVRARVEA